MTMYLKGGAAPVGYLIDWGPGWLRGAAIAASHWRVEGGGAAEPMIAEDRPADAGMTGVTLHGGTAGARYLVCNEVLLSDGRRGARTLSLAVSAGR